MYRLPATLVIAAVLAVGADCASAQHKHAHPLRSQHGGEVVEGRRHHFELVLVPAPTGDAGRVELSLYVTNHHNKPVTLEKAQADALLKSAGREARTGLSLVGKDQLKGSVRFEPGPDLEVQVSVAIGQLPAEKLVFRPMKGQR